VNIDKVQQETVLTAPVEASRRGHGVVFTHGQSSLIQPNPTYDKKNESTESSNAAFERFDQI
jgi:hypothetical protein